MYGTCLGRKVALLSYKSSGTVESTWRPCLSPYDVAPDAPVPTSTYAAHELWEEARARYESLDASVPITVARVRMSRWELGPVHANTPDYVVSIPIVQKNASTPSI